MIELSRVSKTYKIGGEAVKDISLTIEDGEFVFVVGRSGSGESILMKLLLKELEPTKGRIAINDTDLGKIPGRYIPRYHRRLDVVSQDFRLLKGRTAFKNVAFAQRVIEVPTQVIKEAVPEVLGPVGLFSKYETYPRQLSGGKQQKVATVRALINNPEILLVDEPTDSLDSFNTHGVMKLLKEINQRGTTVVVVTRSQGTVDEANKRAITMERRAVISDEGGYYSEYQSLFETGPGLLVPGRINLYHRARVRRKGK